MVADDATRCVAGGPAGLVAGALAAVTAVGEFVASVVLYTHANRPISIEILAQLRALAFGTAASTASCS